MKREVLYIDIHTKALLRASSGPSSWVIRAGALGAIG